MRDGSVGMSNKPPRAEVISEAVEVAAVATVSASEGELCGCGGAFENETLVLSSDSVA